MAKKLTGKQSRFVNEYIVCLNATEACRRAKYGGDDAALAAAGSRLLRNAKILEAIDARLKPYAMSADEVLIHLTDIARGDIADALNGGAIDPTEAIRRGKSHLIKRIKFKTITTTDKDGEGSDIHETEIEMYDRLRALDLLAKYHDLVNRIHIDDWRSQAIEDIKAGRITYDQLAGAFDHSLAAELFASAGVPVSAR